MASLYLINKRFVDVDMSCDEYLEAQEVFLRDNQTEEKQNSEEGSMELSVFEDLDLSLISLRSINEIVYEEVSKSTQTYAKKALDAYNISTYKTSLKPSVVIRNFEKEQE